MESIKEVNDFLTEQNYRAAELIKKLDELSVFLSGEGANMTEQKADEPTSLGGKLNVNCRSIEDKLITMEMVIGTIGRRVGAWEPERELLNGAQCAQ